MFKQGIDKKPTWQSTCQEVTQAGRGKEVEQEQVMHILEKGVLNQPIKLRQM